MIPVPSHLLAASALFVLASAPFPAIDIRKLCADAQVAVDADRAAAACRRQETAARDRLRSLWGRLSAEERSVCVGDAELGTARSYADMVGCIDTSRELDREKALKAPRRAEARRGTPEPAMSEPAAAPEEQVQQQQDEEQP